jgi:hypothetical protein
LYQSRPVLACYDNSFDAGAAGQDAGQTGNDAGQSNQGDQADQEKRFSQSELNTILGQDRRKHDTKVREFQKLAADALAAKDASEQQNSAMATKVAELESKLSELTMSAEERAQKAVNDRIAAANSRAEKAEAAEKEMRGLYTRSTIESQLTGVITRAGGDPKILIPLLAQSSRLVPIMDAAGKETGRHEVVFDLDGQTYGAEAGMKAMADQDTYKPLFRGGAVGGTGTSNSVGTQAGGSPAAGTPVDVATMVKSPGGMAEFNRRRNGTDAERASIGLGPRKPR